MKQTAMQQAIKEIADLWSSPSDTPTYTQIFKVLENKLQMEKQQIVDAYETGDKYKTEISGEQYYNEQFKNK